MKIWDTLYQEALKALHPRKISEMVEAGAVAAYRIGIRKNICWSLCRYSMYTRDMRRKKCYFQYDN